MSTYVHFEDMEDRLEPAICLEHLRSITDGDTALESQLFNLYQDTLRRCVDQMNVALSDDTGHIWRAAVHELKGASRNIGAEHMADICSQYEMTTAYDARKMALERIVEECARIEIFIEDLPAA